MEILGKVEKKNSDRTYEPETEYLSKGD